MTANTPAPQQPIPVPPGIERLAKVFCGCATAANTWGAVLAELERLDRVEFKADDDLVSAIVDYLDLSEHGVSIRGGWLTDDGKVALDFLRTYGIDWDDKGIEFKGKNLTYGI